MNMLTYVENSYVPNAFYQTGNICNYFALTHTSDASTEDFHKYNPDES